MCSATAVWRPLRWERRWLATRWPLWKHATVRALTRASSDLRTNAWGTE